MNEEANRLSREAWLLFGAYVAFLILLPTGSVFGVNVKVLTFLPLFIFTFARSVRSNRSALPLVMQATVVFLLVCWTLLSQFYPTFDGYLSLSQFKDVITTLAGCWFIRILTENDSDKKAFLRLVLNVTAFGCLLKGMIFLYGLRAGVPVSDIVDRISASFGVKLMTADLGDTSVRLQFTSDNLLPACLFALLCLRKKLGIGSLRAVSMMVLLMLSALYTFSRYLWASAAMGIVLGMFAAKRDRLHWLYVAVAGAATAYFFPLISALVAFRFSDQLVESSDVERVDQIRALKGFFWDAPFFGHGLGSYTTDVIRSVETPYNYEVQLLALAGQVGIVGLTFFAILLVNYYRKAFHAGRESWFYQASVFLLLAIFIGAALFNPTLLTSMSAAIFGFLYVLAALGTCHSEAHEKADEPRPAMLVFLRTG